MDILELKGLIHNNGKTHSLDINIINSITTGHRRIVRFIIITKNFNITYKKKLIVPFYKYVAII